MKVPRLVLQRRRCLGVPQERAAKDCALQELQLMRGGQSVRRAMLWRVAETQLARA